MDSILFENFPKTKKLEIKIGDDFCHFNIFSEYSNRISGDYKTLSKEESIRLAKFILNKYENLEIPNEYQTPEISFIDVVVDENSEDF